ncbi:MAG: GTPase domain-containing protein [Candidatus Hodarchaeales archaeon]
MFDLKSLENLKFTGFRPANIDTSNMIDVDVKKMVFIGDGMSGKTQIILTLSRLITIYLIKVFSKSKAKGSSGDDFLNVVDAALGNDTLTLTESFKAWVREHKFLVKYGRSTWEEINSVTLDTETIGFEDFNFSFPYLWKGMTYRVNFSGADIGGQNIFDHFRNVMGKLANKGDVILVVFDKSRAFSCWNSIEQIKSIISDKTSMDNMPKIFYIGNKIDLEEHIRTQSWRASLQRQILTKLKSVTDFGKGVYYVPSLVGSTEQERKVNYRIQNNKMSFPDLEAFIYNCIRGFDKLYNKTMTDVNCRAIAREIAAQLVFDQKIESEQSEDNMVEVMKKFGYLLFQRRPLAIQYSGGIEYTSKGSEGDSFGRVREKWSEYSLDTTKVTQNKVEASIMAAGNSRSFLKQMGEFYSTNGLTGEGILEILDFAIRDKIESAEKQPDNSQKSQVIRRKIKRF